MYREKYIYRESDRQTETDRAVLSQSMYALFLCIRWDIVMFTVI